MQYNPTYYDDHLSPFYFSRPPSRAGSGCGSSNSGSSGNSSTISCHSNSVQDLEGIEARSAASFSIYEIPPPDVNEEDMRINGEIIQNVQDWADFLDGTRKCDFEHAHSYRGGGSSNRRYQDCSRQSAIRRWLWEDDGLGEAEEDNRSACGWAQKMGAAFFIGLIPIVGFLACSLLSYLKVFRPLLQLSIQASERKGLKKSMIKCIITDFAIGMMYPATPFIRRYFCSNRRMTFQARHRVIDHADRCTQAINQAKAEMIAASSIRARALKGGIDNTTDHQRRDKSKLNSCPNPHATFGLGTGAARIADITNQEKLRRTKLTLSAPARLERGFFHRYRPQINNPVENWMQRIGDIWRQDTMKAVLDTNQTTIINNGLLQQEAYGTYKIQAKGMTKDSVDTTAGIGTASKIMCSPPLELRPGRQRGFKSLRGRSRVTTSAGKVPTVTTALLGNNRDRIGEGSQYGASGSRILPHVVIDSEYSVKEDQPLMIKHQQVSQNSCRRVSVLRGDYTQKQPRMKQSNQHYGEQAIVQPQPQLRSPLRRVAAHRNLQDLVQTADVAPNTRTVETLVKGLPKQETSRSGNNLCLNSDLKVHQIPQSQEARRQSHIQDCEHGCREHKVRTKEQSESILRYPTVSFVDANISGNSGIVAPVDLSFVVPLAEPCRNKATAVEYLTVNADVDSAIRKLQKPQARNNEVVMATDKGGSKIGAGVNVEGDFAVIDGAYCNDNTPTIGVQMLELPVQIQLPPPPTAPLPPLPEIATAAPSSS